MQYPSFPQPESAPAFPHHSDMLAYLDAYAEANDLTRHVRFGAMVESAEPADGGWNVTVVGERPRHFDWLVVAAGHYWQPIVPELSGAFTGETMHVREYRTPLSIKAVAAGQRGNPGLEPSETFGNFDRRLDAPILQDPLVFLFHGVAEPPIPVVYCAPSMRKP